jgi:hypothetical protein
MTTLSKIQDKHKNSGWTIEKMDSLFFGNKYEVRHQNGGHYFCKNLSEVEQKISQNHTYPACHLDTNIPVPTPYKCDVFQKFLEIFENVQIDYDLAIYMQREEY